MNNKQILGRLYNDYTKKFLGKIIIAAFFSILVAGSTSSIAWLLDPAIEKIFVEKDQTLIFIIPIFFYFGAIFWTLGYDTIYGYQDIKDDEIIGVKSTSIKFKNNPKSFLILCYSIFLALLILVGFLMQFSNIFYLTLTITFLHLFFYQIKFLNTKIPENCMKIFKSNNLLGLIVFLNIIAGKSF